VALEKNTHQAFLNAKRCLIGAFFLIFTCKNNSHKGTLNAKSTLVGFISVRKSFLSSSSSSSFSKTFFNLPPYPFLGVSIVVPEKMPIKLFSAPREA